MRRTSCSLTQTEAGQVFRESAVRLVGDLPSIILAADPGLAIR
jgi:hypothetical protein